MTMTLSNNIISILFLIKNNITFFILLISKNIVFKCTGNDDDSFKETDEEPLFQYIPESPTVMSSDPLIQSILLLGDGLASGSLITQFEQLYRHKPETSMDNARILKYKNKNRYRDIAPCEIIIITL